MFVGLVPGKQYKMVGTFDGSDGINLNKADVLDQTLNI